MAGIYIHIPFCKSKCNYCDFYSISDISFIENYITCLKQELLLKQKFLSKKDKVTTIYFGGGTPSLLEVKYFDIIICEIKKYFVVEASPEITIEVNPDDITEEYVKKIADSCVNRVSIGVQSFDDKELEYLGRRHTAQQSKFAIEIFKKYDILNLSIDLIFGLPISDMKIWKKSLNYCLEYEIPHISVYALTIEEGTRLYHDINANKIVGPDEDMIVKQYLHVISFLKINDYLHYEVSNFCKNGFNSQHNSSYWRDIKYLGLGPSAHSYDGEKRYWNYSDFCKYQDLLKEGVIPEEYEILSDDDRYNEFILTSLRTNGINSKEIKEKYGLKYFNYFMNNIENLLESNNLVKEDGYYRILENKKLFTDKITSELFYFENE